MKIASWNIASVRARLHLLPEWLKTNAFDIICLQETKAQDKDFPYEFFEDFGYHVCAFGQKSFNGVAILAKKTPDNHETLSFGSPKIAQARALSASFSCQKGSIQVICLYVPNGNPLYSEKYSYKLNWLEDFYHFAKEALKTEDPLLLAGDFNIIPQPLDAKDPTLWEDDALFQPKIRQAFFKLCHLGYQDAIRLMSDEPCYSFWDFQGQAFRRNNGIRIDHFLLSPRTADLLENAYVQKEVRAWEKTSDHAPIILDLKGRF